MKHVASALVVFVVLIGVCVGIFSVVTADRDVPASTSKLTYEEIHKLTHAGTHLTSTDAAELEGRLVDDPYDLRSRLKLLGYHGEHRFDSTMSRVSRGDHILWIIEHEPRLPMSRVYRIDPLLDWRISATASALWRRNVESYPNDVTILRNAANFFEMADSSYAVKCYEKLLDASPKDADAAHALARLVARRAWSNQDAWSKAYDTHVKGLASGGSLRRFYALGDTALAAFRAGKLTHSERHARELLRMASDYADDWNYGNAIHDANMILGRIAMQEGDVDSAAEHLIEAGKTPGSPQLDSFGPDMRLASELLKAGRDEVVIEYLDLCAAFWDLDRGQLEKWKKVIRIGGTPNFGVRMGS